MKYTFIINPASGQGKHETGIAVQIEELIAKNPEQDIKVYYTGATKDATTLAEMISREATDDVVIFACGGDGTVQEVASGLVGSKHGILGVVPVGSGNDFVRTLGESREAADKFLNLNNYIKGQVKAIDIIKFIDLQDSNTKPYYAVNGINVGFDGNTAVLAHKLKEMPLVAGSASYLLAVAYNLGGKRGENLKITADGEQIWDGPMLLATVANGRYCGGGVQSCPKASLNDGLLELLVVKNITRKRFISLFPKYKAGRIFEAADFDRICKYRQAKTIRIEPLANETMQFAGDGEIFETHSIEISVVKDGIRVLVP